MLGGCSGDDLAMTTGDNPRAEIRRSSHVDTAAPIPAKTRKPAIVAATE